MRMIFVNLPVADLSASKAFFAELGFSFNDQFTDEDAACMIVDENIYVMLLSEARFGDFIKGEIADPETTEVLVALSCAGREEIDDLVSRAIAAGGQAWMPPQEHPGMYGSSFRDLDGHVWELMYMEQAA